MDYSFDSERHAEKYARYLAKLGEPSLWKIAQHNADAEQYRVLILAGISPVHSVRIKANRGGPSTAIVKRLNVGTRITGNKALDFSTRNSVSQERIVTFKEALNELDFWNRQTFDPLATGDDVICLHPTFFVFEAVKDGQYKFYHESVCRYTKVTSVLIPAFYQLSEIGPETADWSLIDYFIDED